jgi:hypothetical protein
MTTVQESPNGHLPQKGYPPAAKVYQQDELSPLDKDALFAGHKVPPPCSVPDLQYEDGTEDSTHNDAGSEPSVLGSNQLPDRCQFTFSDGRQCRMARSDIHPSLCRFHAEREDQLFGDPAPGGNVVGAALDLPELHSACRDLTTAAGVNRALAQVFRLLAQRRISRQEAATFGHLAQLLLRTISLMRSSRESHGDQELSRVNKVDAAPGDSARPDATNAVIPSEQRERRTSPSPNPEQEMPPAARPRPASPSPFESNGLPKRETDVPSSPPEDDSLALGSSPSRNPSASGASIPGASYNHHVHGIEPNPRRISTSENAEFKAVQNEHLQKNRGPSGARKSLPSCGESLPTG